MGLANAALISYITRGKEPWTLKHHADHQSLNTAANSQKIYYPKPDGVLSFDRLSSVHLSNTNHEENQPAHLTLKDATIPISTNLALYDAPEQRYCPAQVYEITEDEAGQPMLQINAQTACIAKPVISKTRYKTLFGHRLKVVVAHFIPICNCSRHAPYSVSKRFRGPIHSYKNTGSKNHCTCLKHGQILATLSAQKS